MEECKHENVVPAYCPWAKDGGYTLTGRMYCEDCHEFIGTCKIKDCVVRVDKCGTEDKYEHERD